MYDICETKFLCKCGGKIDHYINEKDISDFYYKCRKCEAVYLNMDNMKSV
jgi:hypothetical protein